MHVFICMLVCVWMNSCGCLCVFAFLIVLHVWMRMPSAWVDGCVRLVFVWFLLAFFVCVFVVSLVKCLCVRVFVRLGVACVCVHVFVCMCACVRVCY